MSGRLARLKTLLAKNRPSEEPPKLTKGAFVGFVSDRGGHFSENEAAVEERAGMASDRVLALYLDDWARLNCQKPARGSEAEWRLALDDGGLFLDAWGEGAAGLGWSSGALFDVVSGLGWRLGGERVSALGARFARTAGGRAIERK